MITIIPKCPNCKSSKDVVGRVADVKSEKTWFHIMYCKKCYEVIECSFQGRVLQKDENANEELLKMEKMDKRRKTTSRRVKR